MTSHRTAASAWLPLGFQHPTHVELQCGTHLRPIRAADVEIDYPAGMGSRERPWKQYVEAWGWPPAHMTFDQGREDLAHHEREIAAHESFNYAVLDSEETELLVCVYIDLPAGKEDRNQRSGCRASRIFRVEKR